MKILFFIDGLRAGGRERRFTELIKSLASVNNIDFEIVLMSNVVHYTEIFDIKTNIHYLIRKNKKDISIFKKFYAICKNYKPDIVHCWDSMTAIYSVPACKLLNIKLVNGMVADAPLKQNILNKIWLRAKVTFPFSDIIIGNSHAGLVSYKAPNSKCFVIYNGYNFERSRNLQKEEDIKNELNVNSEYVIGMVASFSRYKDYKTYYDAAVSILKERSDIVFLSIGSETDSDISRQLVNIKYREKHFRFLGEKSNIESYINILDIGVLATFTEGISNSIMEYMALGKPVVATSGGGTDEIIENNMTGYLVDTSDADEMADKIKILLNDPKLRIKMGEYGKKRIHNLFSIDAMTRSFISVYNQLLNKQ